MTRKIVSLIITLSMLMSMFTVGIVSVQAAETESEPVASSTGLADNVQNGQILQCWNWSFDSIKNNMAKIANQGFSAIQTSPIQGTKESTKEYYSTMQNNWWVYYQPINFNIETNSYNALGTATEFKAMCEEAHKYGVKVIVDAVLNHTANNNANNSVSTMVPSDLRDDVNCWHDITRNSWYESRWDITQFCMEGLPDLNTWNSKVQSYAINFLKECIDAGADGFRFDGAKHIETPVDTGFSSEFWPNVTGAATSYAQSTRGFTPYYYGEVLDKPSGSNDTSVGQTVLNSYTTYMSVTQSPVSNSIRNAVNSGNTTTASRSDFYFDDGSQAAGSKNVLWNESHDTYADGESSGISDTVMKKTWAIVGSRAEACGMYMARPNSLSDKLGTGSVTAWGDNEVKAVNWLKNNYIGQSEYLSRYDSIVYNERGTTGAVLVNLSGNEKSISVTANKLEAGTYNDAITGNTFTVSNGKISGYIGSTGIAVIRKNATTSSSSSTASSSSTVSSSSTTSSSSTASTSVPIYFDNSSYNWSTVYAYIYNGATQNATWPGQKMSYDSSTGYYKLTVSAALSGGKVIFTESSSATTNRYPADGVEGLSIDGTSKLFSSGNSWKAYTASSSSSSTSSTSSATVYFDNSSYNWSTVYAYAYNGATQNAAWPGQQMTLDSSTGYYKITLTGDLSNGKVIFTESSSATTNRYPADGVEGLSVGGKTMIFGANRSWTEYTASTTDTTQRVYFDNSSYNWSSVYTYIYSGSTSNASWPGVKMTYDSTTGYYVANVSSSLQNGYAIFTESSSATTNRYPADGAQGLSLGGKTMVFGANNSWSEYSSSSAAVATVNRAATTTTASSSSTTASSISLSASNITLTAGKTYTLTQTSDSTSVTWSTSNATVATVAQKSTTQAVVTAVAAGTATITAKVSTTVKATCKVTVSATTSTSSETDSSISDIQTTNISLTAGNSYVLTQEANAASSTGVTWSSSNPNVASVSKLTSSMARVNAVTSGTTTITAKIGDTVYGKWKATVSPSTTSSSNSYVSSSSSTVSSSSTPTSISLDKTSLSLTTGATATLTHNSSSSSVVWCTSNAKVATVSKLNSTQAKVTAVSAGTATITAKLSTTVKATCKVTVTSSGTSSSSSSSTSAATVTLNKTSLTLAPGATYTLTATTSTGESVAWYTSNSKIVSGVVKSTGVVITAVAVGTATITAKLSSTVKAQCKVTVSNSATSSSSSSSSTVSSSSATSSSSSSTTPTVTLSKTSLSLTAGSTYTLTQTSTGGTVSWLTSNAKVATVAQKNSTQAVVTAVAAGSCTITAKISTTVKAQCKVTVTAASSSSSTSSSSSSSSSSSATSGTYTIKFTNAQFWSGTIYCYYWSDSNTSMTTWPGTKMTSLGTNDYGETVYSLTIPSTAQHVIFTNGTLQTVNLDVNSSQLNFYTVSDKDSSGNYECGTW